MPMAEKMTLDYARGPMVPPAPWWFSVAAIIGLTLGLLYVAAGIFTAIQAIRFGMVPMVLAQAAASVLFGAALSVAEHRARTRRSECACRVAGLLWIGMAALSVATAIVFPGGGWEGCVVRAVWGLVSGALGTVHLIYAFGRRALALAVASEE